VDDNQRRLIEKGRRLQPEQARKLRAAMDPGHSWGNILRFADISFAEGGEFKLCFCDSSLLGANEICDSAEDFTIEVGKVHATVLQCLLSDPKMTRATCESQLYGGLRCYDGNAPTVIIPSEFQSVPHPSDPKGGSVDDTYRVPGCYISAGVCDCTITQAECATLVDSGLALLWYSRCNMDSCGTRGGYNPKRANEWSDMTTMLASYCQYSTAEEAAQLPICDQWRDDAYDIEMDAGRPKSPYDLESRGGASP